MDAQDGQFYFAVETLAQVEDCLFAYVRFEAPCQERCHDRQSDHAQSQKQSQADQPFLLFLAHACNLTTRPFHPRSVLLVPNNRAALEPAYPASSISIL